MRLKGSNSWSRLCCCCCCHPRNVIRSTSDPQTDPDGLDYVPSWSHSERRRPEGFRSASMLGVMRILLGRTLVAAAAAAIYPQGIELNPRSLDSGLRCQRERKKTNRASLRRNGRDGQSRKEEEHYYRRHHHHHQRREQHQQQRQPTERKDEQMANFSPGNDLDISSSFRRRRITEFKT